MISKITSGFGETKREFHRINWPTRAQTIRYTAVVIGFALAAAVYLGALDYIFAYLLRTFVLR